MTKRCRIDPKADEIKAARARIQDELKDQTLLRVNYAALHPDSAAYNPDNAFFLAAGWYRDEPFHCVDCGRLQIWTAAQQKWWYETAKGSVLTRANRCRVCRKRYQEERAAHRARTHAGRTQS